MRHFKNQDGSYQDTYNFLASTFLPQIETDHIPLTSFISSVQQIERKRRSLNKTKSKTVATNKFLTSVYQLPKPRKTEAAKRENETCVLKNGLMPTELSKVSSELGEELHDRAVKIARLEGKTDCLQKALMKTKERLSKCEPKCVTQKLKRKQEQISKRDKVIKELRLKQKQQIGQQSCSRSVAEAQTEAVRYKKQKKSMRNYYKERMKKSSQQGSTAHECEVIKELKNYIATLQDEMSQLQDKLAETQVYTAKLDGKTDPGEL